MNTCLCQRGHRSIVERDGGYIVGRHWYFDTDDLAVKYLDYHARLHVLQQERIERFVLIVRRRVQKMVLAMRTFVHDLDSAAEHRANDLVGLLDSDT